MRKINFLVSFFVLVSFFAFSQENEGTVKKKSLPVSIYTVENKIDTHGFSAINKRLQLTAFTFIFSDDKYREFNYFTIKSKNFQKNTYSVIDNDLFRFKEKSFQFKIDPTLWPATAFVYKN